MLKNKINQSVAVFLGRWLSLNFTAFSQSSLCRCSLQWCEWIRNVMMRKANCSFFPAILAIPPPRWSLQLFLTNAPANPLLPSTLYYPQPTTNHVPTTKISSLPPSPSPVPAKPRLTTRSKQEAGDKPNRSVGRGRKFQKRTDPNPILFEQFDGRPKTILKTLSSSAVADSCAEIATLRMN